MDGIQYAVVTRKGLRLLGKNQYTSNAESGSTKPKIQYWVELFFGVKVLAIEESSTPRKG
jgi:ribosomal protein L23